MTTVAVIGGTSTSLRSNSIACASEELGNILAQRDSYVLTCGVRYGVIGIILDSLQISPTPRAAIVLRGAEEKNQHPAAGPITLVDSIAERNALFMDRASDIIALPGGLGTHDEILCFLMLMKKTQRRLTLLNVDGYFNPLLDQVSNMISAGFVRPEIRRAISICYAVKDIAQ